MKKQIKITLTANNQYFKDLAIVCMDILLCYKSKFTKKELLNEMKSQLINNGYNATIRSFAYP